MLLRVPGWPLPRSGGAAATRLRSWQPLGNITDALLLRDSAPGSLSETKQTQCCYVTLLFGDLLHGIGILAPEGTFRQIKILHGLIPGKAGRQEAV